MRELLIATRNEGKMPEIRHALEGVPFHVIDINDVPELTGFEPEEHGATFEENAILKAKEYGARSGMLTLADDSGIEVDALNGMPGVRSARYVEGSDEDRMYALLKNMEDVPDSMRGAQFTSVITLYDPVSGTVRTCEGICRGSIMREPRGEKGFGYDPIFFSDEAQKGMAEVSLEEKNHISHRGKALVKARDILIAEFS